MIGGAGFVYHKHHQFTPTSTVLAAFLDDDSNADVSFRTRDLSEDKVMLAGYVADESDPRFNIHVDGRIRFGAGVLDADTASNTLFRSADDGKLKFRDNSGTLWEVALV
jgi:hypothetical protein